jgi:hypothetical protein
VPHYRVLIRGSNFWMAQGDRPAKVGFFVTRLVHAPDKGSACRAVLERVGREVEMRKLTSAPDEPSRIEVEEIEEAELGDAPARPGGFAFHQDEAEDAA